MRLIRHSVSDPGTSFQCQGVRWGQRRWQGVPGSAPASRALCSNFRRNSIIRVPALGKFLHGEASHPWRQDAAGCQARPDTGLALAREKADKARALVAAGTDPGSVRKMDRAPQAASVEAERRKAGGPLAIGSFEQVAREWLANVHALKVSVGHAARTQLRFEQDVFPCIGRRPIGAIDPPELLACLRRIEARGRSRRLTAPRMLADWCFVMASPRACARAIRRLIFARRCGPSKPDTVQR